jgi:2-dehydropantoate 2-reductase
VVGAGSTGGYYGGRLAQAGRDVTFLVRPARAAKLRANGLTIISPYGDASLHPRLVTADAIDGFYDVVLLAVKAFQLDAVLADMAPAIGPDTMILPVLNGMRHMQILEQRFTPKNVLGCALKVTTILDEEGRIVQLSPLDDFAYGEMDGANTARIAALNGILTGAGFNARLSPAIRREMWEKWMLLAALGGITCLMRGTVGEIEAAGGRDFVLAFLDEVIGIIRAIGTPPSEKSIAQAREQLTQKGSAATSSMYRDVQKSREIEVEQILGDLLHRGRDAGIEAPLISAAYINLCIYQNRITTG